MKFLKTLLAAALLSLSVPSLAAQSDPVVKVVVEGGHGSGSHLGNGFILTAAHVASEGIVRIRTDQDEERQAEVLWSSKAYDISLLKYIQSETPLDIGSLPLPCGIGVPAVGERIRARGNPFDIDGVQTTGTVAKRFLKPEGPWRSVFIADMSVLPGMSGGPVLDDDNRIRGVIVGMLGRGSAFGGPMGSFGLAYIVPTEVVCNLLGR